MEEVRVQAVPVDELTSLVGPERAERFDEGALLARQLLAGRIVWNVSSTAAGGGVAEMLQTILAYGRGAGVDTRWLVLHGDPAFFEITKRLHNHLHGVDGAAPSIGEADRAHYEEVLASNASSLLEHVRPTDIVLLHDPQTAGLVQVVRAVGAKAVWRCHVGIDGSNEWTEAGWSFLRPYIREADAFVFSRAAYAPAWVPRERLTVVPPSIDPVSGKNCELSADVVLRVLRCAGLLPPDSVRPVPFVRRDGTHGMVQPREDVLFGGPPPPDDARMVVQVSRWDRLKDMGGVMQGFVDALPWLPDDAHLVLAGPAVSAVTDDPEGLAVLTECEDRWCALPPPARARVHLARLPMDDLGENAVIVNALQRRAAVVVQKSLAEGFGLTVTEAMWKGRPVVASAVGGITDQAVDGEEALLLKDPRDLAAMAHAVDRLLRDPALAERIATAAHVRAHRDFLGDRHLLQYASLFDRLLR